MAEREQSAEALDIGQNMDEGARLRAVPDTHSPGLYERFGKPVIDRLAGVILTIVTLPLVAVIVPLIWWQMGRPAVFTQERVGRFGHTFTVYKFRTMMPDRRGDVVSFDGQERRVNHKSMDDPRHTGLGRFLRKWSLDEIPQFWNLALGHMSLIGPRPELPSIVERYEPWQHRRHEVKPGLTGLWQVSARGEVPMHEATHIDVAYVDEVSLVQDLKIVARTPKAMLGSNKGH